MKSMLEISSESQQLPADDLAQRPIMTTPFICPANGYSGGFMDVVIRLPPWNEGWQRKYWREGTPL
jgi:hypothetical protein